jgi:hypothetical protein
VIEAETGGEKEAMSDKAGAEIIVVMRSDSAAAFRPGQALALRNVPCSVGPVQVTYSTQWVRVKPGVDIPESLQIEVAGSARELEGAISPLASAGLAGLPVISLSANAAIGEPRIELAFDTSPGKTERDFFQVYVPSRPPVVRNTRFLDIFATRGLIEAMDSGPEPSRLFRAANRYRVALDYWHFGRESLSVAHLWMAVEALTKARLRAECSRQGLTTEEELAGALGVGMQSLDSTVRERLILGGDHECYAYARKASDGFEHGFEDFDVIRGLSRTVRERMAKHVRQAILELCLDSGASDQMDSLTAESFSKPLGCWPIDKYIRGKIVGSGDVLAPNGSSYPSLLWTAVIESAGTSDDCQYEVELKEEVAPRFAPGMSFRPESFEAWQPG